MRVFAISDLHLSASGDKPMDVFGPRWERHAEKIERNWRRVVGPDDVVLIAGDLSWAMHLEEALPDIALVSGLPGVKFLIQGNHDYWFGGPAKVRAVLGPGMHLVRCDAHVVGGVGVCGVRGWTWAGLPDYDPDRDQRHVLRAQTRMRLSLEALARLDWDVAVAMFHYPPLAADRSSDLCGMIARAGVRYAVYGHMHGEHAAQSFEGERDGVLYRCVSADHVGFEPLLLLEHPASSP